MGVIDLLHLIDRLEEQSKRLLQAAAVLGDDVVEVLLADVSGIFFETLRDHIHRLVQGEFLYEASLYPDLGYAFKHPLTREVAYGTLLRDRRRELHAAAAQAIETAEGATGPSLRAADTWLQLAQSLIDAGYPAAAVRGIGCPCRRRERKAVVRTNHGLDSAGGAITVDKS